jgi:hypothetical protein
MLRPTLNTILSIPEISSFPGNSTAAMAYPGRNSTRRSPSKVRTSMELKRGVNTNRFVSNTTEAMIRRSLGTLLLIII